MIRRPPRSTQSRSSAASDVYKRQRDAGDWKRSNKDLGRVLAMAHLTLERDRREGTNEFEEWPQRMWDALQEKFGADARTLAMGAHTGIDALLALSLIHISEPTRLGMISYAVFCL